MDAIQTGIFSGTQKYPLKGQGMPHSAPAPPRVGPYGSGHAITQGFQAKTAAKPLQAETLNCRSEECRVAPGDP